MILHEKLEKPYEDCTIRSVLWFRCDYCGADFQRDKKSRERLCKIIQKDGCGAKECSNRKRADVFALRYGDGCLFKTKSFKESQAATNLEKYGTEEYFDSEDFKEKRTQGMLANHGVENPLQSADIRLKQQQTCLERHGVTNYSQADDYLAKRAATCLERYGDEVPMRTEACMEKRDLTNKERFGETNYTKTDEYWERRKATCLDRYGVEHPSQLPENREKAKETCLERYAEDNYAKTEEFKERYKTTCLEKFGVANPLFLQENQRYGKTQAELMERLNAMGFAFGKGGYGILGDREIDLYDDAAKIGIEYCGLFWHNEFSSVPRTKWYHYDKFQRCFEKGIRLVTIFEDEWKHRQTQCEGVLRAMLGRYKYRIHARDCTIEECSKADFGAFCDANHIQGATNLGLASYGLFLAGEMIGGMSLGQHHRVNDVLVLDRLCFRSDIRITGGSERLLDRCKKWASLNGHKEIVTWSDNRWSQGRVYGKLGFTLDAELPPDYSYVDARKPAERISKQSQKKSNTACPQDKTEYEWAIENGLARIWDCGKKRWLLQLQPLG